MPCTMYSHCCLFEVFMDLTFLILSSVNGMLMLPDADQGTMR